MSVGFPDSVHVNPKPKAQLGGPSTDLTRAMGAWKPPATPSFVATFEEPVETVGRAKQVVQRVGAETGVEEKIFDRLVALKVMTSQYAMHLVREEQDRLFAELDYLLSMEGWSPEDELPSVESFRSFIRWAIYAKAFNWSSLGISNAGTILVAWESDKTLMTADFVGGDRVLWTASRQSDSDPQGEHAAGDSSLKAFARQTDFYFAE